MSGELTDFIHSDAPIIAAVAYLLDFSPLARTQRTGGGLIRELVAAAAFALYMIATDVTNVKRILRIESRTLIGVGLLICLISGLISLFRGLPFMTGLWSETPLPVIGKVGTPLLFDTGATWLCSVLP